jgi:hypothetical protein
MEKYCVSFEVRTECLSIIVRSLHDVPTRSRFSVVFLGPRANAELVPKFHAALHASHAALPMLT